MLALDHLLFGDGHGLKSPYFDDRFYWLVDTADADRSAKRGRLYTFTGGLGAQLRSFEWRAPRAGTRRRLAGRDFVVFNCRRNWLRVDVAWALADLPRDLDAAHATIRDLQASLGAPLTDCL